MADFKRSWFLELQDYILNGSKDQLPDEAFQYLDILHIVNGTARKYGKAHAISFIQGKPYEISYRDARRMYDESINLFYTDSSVEPSAQRNWLYEKLTNAAAVVLASAESPLDMQVYADIIFKAYKVKEPDLNAPPKLPEGLYKKPFKIYSLDPAAIGLPTVNRNEIAALIDEMEIPGSEATRLKKDARIEDINFEEMLDDQEEKTQSE